MYFEIRVWLWNSGLAWEQTWQNIRRNMGTADYLYVSQTEAWEKNAFGVSSLS